MQQVPYAKPKKPVWNRELSPGMASIQETQEQFPVNANKRE
jgi:hypothetical protein